MTKEIIEDGCQLIELIQEGIWIIDQAGNIRSINSYLVKMLGYSIEEMIGQPMINFIGEPYQSRCLAIINRTDKRVKETFECQLILKDNGCFHSRLSISFLSNNNHYSGAIILVTELVESQNELLIQPDLRTNKILESITDAVYVVDAEWCLTYVNREIEIFWGDKRENLIGKQLWDIFPDEETNHGYLELHRAFRERIPVSFENFFPILQIWVEANVYPTVDGGLSVFFRDITEKKRMEKELKTQYSILQGILKSHDSPAFSLDANYCYTGFNQAHQQAMQMLYGARIELGRNILDYQTVAEDRMKTKTNLERVLQGEHFVDSAYSGELDHIRKYFEVTHYPIRDDDGQIIGIVVFAHDITARIVAEENLKYNEERFRSMFENHEAIMMLIEPESGAIVEVNKAAVAFYGYTQEQLCTMYIQEINKLEYDEVAAMRLKTLKRKESHFIFQHRLASGKIRWVEVYSTPIRVKESTLLFSIIHDVTERKKAGEALFAYKKWLEEAQRESEERYQDLFKNSPGAIILHDGVYILEVNPAVGTLLGYINPDELIGTKLLEIIAPDYRELASSRIRFIQNKGIATSLQEIHFLNKDGREVYAETVSGVCHLYGRKVMQIIVHDINERKQLEMKLTNRTMELSHALVTMETMLATIPIGVLVAEADDESISYSSPAVQEIFEVPILDTATGPGSGKPRRIQLLRTDRTVIPPSDYPLARALRKGEPTENEEIIIYHFQGREKTVVINCSPVCDEQGKILRAVASVVNITRRKQIENNLRESEERFRILTESLPQLVWVTDEVGNITYYNSRAHEYIGNQSEAKGWNWTSVIHPADIQQTIAVSERALLTGEIFQTEYRVKRYDGEYRWFLGRSLPLRDKQGQIICWFGSCTDIHYQKQLEIELQESNSQLHLLNKQVMTTLEDERSMIARELHDEAGQALTALKIYIELLLKEISLEAYGLRQKISEALILTDQTLLNVRRLAQDLRPPALDTLGLNLTLEDFCHEFGKRTGLNIHYQGCELPPLTSIATISLYRFLQEALTNVVKHANAKTVDVQLDCQNQKITLLITDDGIGFDMNSKSLKEKGMGLLGMQERLKMQGGILTVDSGPGRGTRLTATIPWEEIS